MSAEDNKALTGRFFQEFWGQKNLAIVDELVAANHADHTPGSPPEFSSGQEGFKKFGMAYFAAFPDLQVTIADQIADENTAVTRWTAHGTNTGSLFGMPATNKAMTITGITIDRIADGKIVESWTNFDNLGMLQQLGVIPSMG